jgi:hypothetical protein
VAAHNGTVDVDTTPGEGSTFRIRLPLTPETDPTTPTSGAPAPSAGDRDAPTDRAARPADVSEDRDLLASG